jgi:hypothetical protein
MWPLGIVVVDEDSEHGLQMPLIQDEEPVQALGPHRPDPAFRVSIRSGRLHRRADHLAGRAAEDLIKGRRELAVPITHEEPVATLELWAPSALRRVSIPLGNGRELRKLLFDREDLDRLIEAWKDGPLPA